MTCAKTSLPVFMNEARSPVGRTGNATGDVQIETSTEHGISSILQLVIRPQRENVGTLLLLLNFIYISTHEKVMQVVEI